MLGKLALAGCAVAVLAVCSIAVGSSSPVSPPSASARVEERAGGCIDWPVDVNRALATEFASNDFDPVGSVGFARSVPVGHVVSVYVNGTGCESQPVSVAEVLPNVARQGVLYVDRGRSHGNNRYDLYSLVEVQPSQPGVTRTFVLARKVVTVTMSERPPAS